MQLQTIGYESAVSRMVLQMTERGPEWFFGQLRLGSLVIESHMLRYESSSVFRGQVQ
jgi:hypothetical protein